jgi:hypothetical protein
MSMTDGVKYSYISSYVDAVSLHHKKRYKVDLVNWKRSERKQNESERLMMCVAVKSVELPRTCLGTFCSRSSPRHIITVYMRVPARRIYNIQAWIA